MPGMVNARTEAETEPMEVRHDAGTSPVLDQPVALLKALIALLPMCVLLSGSVVRFLRRKTVASFLPLLGAGCLVVVVLTHVAEALHWVPSMHWGDKQALVITLIYLVLCSVSRCF
jgi:hypothetical protein